FTGREYIWLNTINLVSEKPYFGYGMSARLPDLMMTKYDAHNTYLQITLETGYIGLILYLLILYKLWRLMFIDVNILNNNIKYLKVFPAFFISLLIYQIFEEGFIKGGYATSVIEWIIVAVGIRLIYELHNGIRCNYEEKVE